MAISYVGAATGTTSATLPAHQAGDLIIGFAFRDGSTTAATLPGGWTDVRSDGLNTCSGRLAKKIAASSSETSGTWTNATSVVFLVYRGTEALDVGATASNTASSTTVNYPALTLNDPDGSSWVAGVAGHRSVDTNLQNPPTGMTNRATVVDATDEAAGHDTNGGRTSWPSTNVSVAGTSSGWRSYVFEVIEAEIAAAVAFTGSGAFSADGMRIAAVRDGYRVTEAGDRRVTEAGDVRITEHFVSAAVSFTSVGSQLFLTAKRFYSVFGFTGAGTATFLGRFKDLASVAWSATGSFFIDAGGSSEAALDWDATGTALFNGTKRKPGQVTFASTGALLTIAGFTREVGVDFAAAGSFALSAGIRNGGAFGVSAAGTFALEAGLIHSGAIEFVGRGGAGARITEDGNRRITENGDVRIVDYPMFRPGIEYQAQTSFSGVSTVAFAGSVEITTSNVDIFFNGIWNDEAETFAKVGGAWVQVIKIYAKQDGVWKLTR